MSSKKELILCNYCKTEIEGKQIYTTRMQFAGSKIIDILQTVAQCTIPVSTPIKMCGMCTSTLLATTGVIEKVGHMVTNLLGSTQKKAVEIQKEVVPPVSDSEVEEVHVEEIQVKPSKAKGTPIKSAPITNGAQQNTKTTKPQAKVKQLQSSTPSKAESSPTKQPQSNKDQNTPSVTTTDSPKKQPKELQVSFKDNLEDSLKDVIKLTPAKEVPKKYKDLTQLFGNSANPIPDSEDDSDDDEVIDIPEASNDFECKLCDYKTSFPAKYKRHLRENHGQKRPRILNCSMCPKSFGVLKTLNKHLETHGVVQKKNDEEAKKEASKTGDAELAVLTALKPTTKPKPILNAEYTFAIKDTNSSTPKPNEEQQKAQQIQLVFTCDFCNMELKYAKNLQDHLKVVHSIEKPKIFKCDACDATFVYKTARDRHFLNKHCGDQDQNKATKTPARRKTIDVRPLSIAVKMPKPKKSPIRRKTIDVSIVESPLAKKENKLEVMEQTTSKETNKEDAVTPSQLNESVKPTESPTKKKVKESKKDDVSSLLKEVFKAAESPSMKKSKEINKEEDADITSIQVDDIAIEEPVADTPSKKTKSKKASDVLDTSQLTPMINGIKKKSHKRKSESSQVDIVEHEEELQNTPVKKSKPEKQKKKSECEIIELLDEININPKPHKREMLESQDMSDSQLSCNHCSKVVSSRKRLDSHIRKKHTPTLNCRKCEQNFADSSEFVSHFENCQSADADGLPCGVKNCDKIFAAPNFLSSHLKKKHKFI
ncbi:zinc finger protein CG2199 [Drosophila innubila]|uniref:zinc finger protein CG2199 n=1 Tax=Drosophila innubila TaxID=198719 RepID=UPI00148D7721|nr:zinc finger protein CG2199 [Drosophila innubila]XP_034481066.1 zinc finger protein CG2199 [Drosophila innubila]